MKSITGSIVGAALVVGILAVAGAQGSKDADRTMPSHGSRPVLFYEESPAEFDLKPVDKK